MNDQQFIVLLNKYFIKDIRDACSRNNNPRAKPKSSDTKSDLINKVCSPISCCWHHTNMVACE